METKASESLYSLSSNICIQLDTELKNMSSLTQKIWFSQPLKDLLYSDLYTISGDSMVKQRKLNEIIYSIAGPQFPVTQINIIQLNGSYFGIGNSYDYTILPASDILSLPWLMDVIKLDGKKLITIPHKDEWKRHDNTVISVSNAYSYIFGEKVNTIIEIQQNYTIFAGIINKALSTLDSKGASKNNVYIFDSKGQTIYPINTNLNKSNDIVKFYSSTIKTNKKQTQTFTVENPYTNAKEIAAFTHSDFSDWTILVSEPESLSVSPVIKLKNNTILATLVILLITLILSYFVSRGLTTPIKKIYKNIKNLSLSSLPENASLQINSGINELEELNYSFSEMCKKLKISLEEVVASRSQEIKANMLALQSQMSPHFLYNTLTNISIMAEDKGNTEIVKTCKDLSYMLRYISSVSTVPVSIRQELEQTQKFIDLMKIRFEDNLVFNMNIPEELLDICVPKLIIQPLVENCTKYGISIYPPLEINIEGICTGNSWKIKIRDNGTGFNDSLLLELNNKLSSIDLKSSSTDLQLDGMGLINICVRLRILYSNEAVFTLSNHPDGGAVVTIGGNINNT